MLEQFEQQVIVAGGETRCPDTALTEAIAGLKVLPVLQREMRRDEIAIEFGIRKSIIDIVLKEDRENNGEDKNAIVTDVEPWGSPVNGNELLNEILESLRSHVVLPATVAPGVVCWVLLTHCCDAFRVLPILGAESPQKRCGKTTLEEWAAAHCNRSLIAGNISSAAVFRVIEKYHPTLLIDEADTYLTGNDELRGVINSGHTRAGAFVVRVQGDAHEPVKFSTWCPKALAMIGRLPETIRDRSIIVSLRRKSPDETIKKMGPDFASERVNVRRMCRRWADDNFELLKTLRPQMPKTGNDRMSENWFPLMCIAMAIGGDWPAMIRKAITEAIDTDDDDSLGVRLLSDIKTIFSGVERLFSDDIVEALKNIPESPWADWSRGKGLSVNQLARLLRPFKITSKTLRINDDRLKGYELSAFQDAFDRYLSPGEGDLKRDNVTNELNQEVTLFSKRDNEIDVTVENSHNYPISLGCHDVTVQKGDTKKNIKMEVM
jgi:putative DNA primase/helicase